MHVLTRAAWQLLLEAKADTSALDGEGMSVMAYAAQEEHYHVQARRREAMQGP